MDGRKKDRESFVLICTRSADLFCGLPLCPLCFFVANLCFFFLAVVLPLPNRDSRGPSPRSARSSDHPAVPDPRRVRRGAAAVAHLQDREAYQAGYADRRRV